MSQDHRLVGKDGISWRPTCLEPMRHPPEVVATSVAVHGDQGGRTGGNDDGSYRGRQKPLRADLPVDLEQSVEKDTSSHEENRCCRHEVIRGNGRAQRNKGKEGYREKSQ